MISTILATCGVLTIILALEHLLRLRKLMNRIEFGIYLLLGAGQLNSAALLSENPEQLASIRLFFVLNALGGPLIYITNEVRRRNLVRLPLVETLHAYVPALIITTLALVLIGLNGFSGPFKAMSAPVGPGHWADIIMLVMSIGSVLVYSTFTYLRNVPTITPEGFYVNFLFIFILPSTVFVSLFALLPLATLITADLQYLQLTCMLSPLMALTMFVCRTVIGVYWENRVQKLIPRRAKIKSTSSTPTSAGLSIKHDQQIRLVPYDSIFYIEAYRKGTVVHTTSEQYTMASYLSHVLADLPPDIFMRVHKSYAVNVNKVSHLQYYAGGSYFAQLSDPEASSVPVGRKYFTEIKAGLGL